MLQAFQLSFSPDPRVGPLFEQLDFSLAPGEKVALVGRNGAGKSLLLSILAGRLTPDRGRVVSGGERIAYLPQDFDHGFDGTLAELLARECPDAPDYVVAKTLHRLGLDSARLRQSYSTLSLGERMRGTLAALLAGEPDVLLLDEPTNHLDTTVKVWLESFLRTSPEAVLLVCHDRMVINAVADRVVELDRGTLVSYTGNYADMLAQKQDRDARQRASWERHREEDRRLRNAAEQMLQAGANVTKKPKNRTFDPAAKPFYAAKQARMDKVAKGILARVKRVRSDTPDKPFEPDAIELEFPSRPLRSPEAVAVRGLRKAYGAQVLFEKLNLTLCRGARIAVVGPNGAGKTTLFRILRGEESADDGTVVWASDARVATLSQARDALDPTQPAIRALASRDSEAQQFARTALARLGMRGDLAERPIGVLSVGERTKVEIVAMLLTGANVLMLDEPTNHLDLASLDALESALVEFPGAILFTSHDRWFVDRVATETVTLGA